MKNFFNNPKNQVIILFLAALVVLLCMQRIPENTNIAGYKTKQFDLFMDVKPDSLQNTQTDKIQNNDSTNINQDTIK
ncbi:MAG: hypothetical protein Q8903_04335 [Bacteroidota bacterium]|nr:hypothetical protein [Bacteroidota bacterium]